MIYGYIRVSTDKQTVENQRLEIEQWCSKKHIVIEAWIEETISGTKSYSKGQFRGLIHKTLQPGDILIVSELSRMSRKLFEIMEVLKFLMENDITLKTVKEGYELGDNITSKVLAFAFGLSAEIERTLISQRTKAGLVKRKSEGVILGRPLGIKGPKKLEGKEEVIKLYLDANISVSAIARILKVHRLTLSDFAVEKGLMEKRETNNTRIVEIAKSKVQDKEIELYREKILGLAYNGSTFNEIVTSLSPDIKVTVSALRGYLKRAKLMPGIVKANKQLRLERNADCGKYKRE